MSKYRRIEVNAYHRRVTVVSGEWRPADVLDAQSARTDEGVSLDDSNSSEPVEPDSPEGQLILVEAVRSLEQRLSPETRALLTPKHIALTSYASSPWFRLRSFYQLIWPRTLRFTRKDK